MLRIIFWPWPTFVLSSSFFFWSAMYVIPSIALCNSGHTCHLLRRAVSAFGATLDPAVTFVVEPASPLVPNGGGGGIGCCRRDGVIIWSIGTAIDAGELVWFSLVGNGKGMSSIMSMFCTLCNGETVMDDFGLPWSRHVLMLKLSKFLLAKLCYLLYS